MNDYLIRCVGDILFILSENENKDKLEDYIIAFEIIDQLIINQNLKTIIKVYFDYQLDLINIMVILDDKEDQIEFCRAYTYFLTILDSLLIRKIYNITKVI